MAAEDVTAELRRVLVRDEHLWRATVTYRTPLSLSHPPSERIVHRVAIRRINARQHFERLDVLQEPRRVRHTRRGRTCLMKMCESVLRYSRPPGTPVMAAMPGAHTF